MFSGFRTIEWFRVIRLRLRAYSDFGGFEV